MESDNHRKHGLRIPPPPGEPKRPIPPLAIQDLSTVELVKQIVAEGVDRGR